MDNCSIHCFESQEQERSRIARDLHDEIGQQLTALLVGLGTVESAKDLQSAQQLAHDLRKVGATAHEEVRRLVRGLRPGVLEELGLAAAIERLCEDFEQVHGVTVRLEAPAAADANNSPCPWKPRCTGFCKNRSRMWRDTLKRTP